MDAFCNARMIEDAGMAMFMDVFDQFDGFRHCHKDDPRSKRKAVALSSDHHDWGDRWFTPEGSRRAVTADMKFEAESKTGNFFIETWSSMPSGDYEGKPGWYVTLKCDWIWYGFLKEKTLYQIDLRSLRRWLGVQESESIRRYSHKTQKKRAQRNLTEGACVPIADVRKNVGYIQYTLPSTPGKRGQVESHSPDGSLPTPPAFVDRCRTFNVAGNEVFIKTPISLQVENYYHTLPPEGTELWPA